MTASKVYHLVFGSARAFFAFFRLLDIFPPPDRSKRPQISPLLVAHLDAVEGACDCLGLFGIQDDLRHRTIPPFFPSQHCQRRSSRGGVDPWREEPLTIPLLALA
jgi:hypothetical protein